MKPRILPLSRRASMLMQNSDGGAYRGIATKHVRPDFSMVIDPRHEMRVIFRFPRLGEPVEMKSTHLMPMLSEGS